MKLFYILLSISLLVGSCENKKQKYILSDPLRKDPNNCIVLSADYPVMKEPISLSQLVDTVFYIALDLDKNTDVSQLYYTDSIIVVNDRKNVYLFNHAGERLNQLPLSTGSCDLSPAHNSLYTYAFLKKEITKYSLEGKKIWSTRLKNEDFGYYGYFFSVINDTLFAISTINEGYNKDQLIFVNEKGRVTDRVSNNEQFPSAKNIYSFNRGWQRSLSTQNKILYYHPFYNDTLFRVEKNRINPVAVEQKIEKVPLNKRLEYTGKSFKEFAEYCRSNNKYATRFYNSMRYLIIEYKIGSLRYALSNYLIYDKKNKVLSRTANDLEKGLKSKILHFGIRNDYDGGLAFAPSYLCDNYMIMVNAGEMQGENGKNTRELFRKGRSIRDTLYPCKSGTAIDGDYLEKTERFFREETNENKILLMIGKLKL